MTHNDLPKLTRLVPEASSASRGLRFPSLRLMAALPLGLVLAGGCAPPAEKDVPPMQYEPKTEVFNASDNLTEGLALTGNYRLVAAQSGELVTLQSVVLTTKGNTQVPTYGVPQTMRLEGILSPKPGQPGWQSAVRTIQNWCAGKNDLTVEVDKQFPYDYDGRLQVQVYFTGKDGEKLNLNRMMVRSGYAVVDIYQATYVDLQKWMNDEESARSRINPKTGKPDPQGLWKLGIILDHRLPPPKTAPTPIPVTPGGGMGAPGGLPGGAMPGGADPMGAGGLPGPPMPGGPPKSD